MKRCIMLSTGCIWNEGIFKAFVFHIFLHWERPSETILYTPRDEKQKKTTTQYLIRITVQIQVHAHNESQLPNILVSVTTLLQCSVVYMGNYFFFSTYECQRRKEKRMSHVLRANNCCLIWAPLSSLIGFVFFFLTEVNCNLPECTWCIWPQPMSLESKRIMPFVQNLDPLLHLNRGSKDVCVWK